jgi:hypothetical protein
VKKLDVFLNIFDHWVFGVPKKYFEVFGNPIIRKPFILRKANMNAKDLRLAQLESVLRLIESEVDLTNFECYILVQKLLKETPEESFKIYEEYLKIITTKKKKSTSHSLMEIRITDH